MNNVFDMDIPTKVYFGSGRLNELSKLRMPGKKALIVTYLPEDDVLKKAGILDRVEKQLEQAGVEYVVFEGIKPNPTKKNVEDGKKAVLENNCDFLVALGGGSVLDATKAIALYSNNDGDLWDFVFSGTGKCQAPKVPAKPFIAITTTAGTGSEVDYGAVITDEEKAEKLAVGDYSEYPIYSIVDPELTKTVNKFYTACQGFDALFHATEVYISKIGNTMSDMVALRDIELIGKYLVRAYNNPDDIEAREGVSFANTLGGFSMTYGNWCTSEHSMEHAMSAYHPELTHGLGLIIISEAYYQAFIDKHVIDERFIDMARALGKTDSNNPQDFITALVELQKACDVYDVDTTKFGLSKEEAPKLVENAKFTNGGMFASDPAELTDEEYADIYRKSFK